MDFNSHIKISTEGRTYEFDLIAKDRDLSSGYKIIPTNESDLPAIRKFLESARQDSALSTDTLASRLQHLSPVSSVKISKLFTTQFSPRLPQDTAIKTTHPQTDSRETVERSLTHVEALLYPEGILSSAQEILASKEDQKVIELALQQPLPGCVAEDRRANDKDVLGFPPALAERRVTMREAMLEEGGEIHQPYLLAGHSFGGACMQAYALEHPEKVAGLVLVDSSSETQGTESGRLGAVQETPHVEFPTDLMSQNLAGLLFDDALNALTAHRGNQSFMENLDTLAKSKGEEPHPFGDLQPAVIGREFLPAEIKGMEEADRDRLQEAAKYNRDHLSSGSINCQSQTLQGVSHCIHCEAPGVVAATILRMAGG